MTELDPGHSYELDHLDGPGKTRLDFVKREGPGYPGNVGHHEGTNLQETWRAGIKRLQRLNEQRPHPANILAIWLLRRCIVTPLGTPGTGTLAISGKDENGNPISTSVTIVFSDVANPTVGFAPTSN